MRGIIIALVLLASPAAARDLGQWENQPPHVRAWFQKLMQPDIPTMSCCGEADAYWADSFEVDGDRYVAIITDERPDGPLGRPHRDSGEKIVVPNHKIKWDDGNRPVTASSSSGRAGRFIATYRRAASEHCLRAFRPSAPIGSQLPSIINEHQALISTLPRSTLRRAVRMLALFGELRRDVEDGRRKVSAVGHELAHD